jgi:hypothetical protein
MEQHTVHHRGAAKIRANRRLGRPTLGPYSIKVRLSHLTPVMPRISAISAPSLAIPSPTRSDPRLRAGLMIDAPSLRQNRRLELPFSFEVLAA